MMSCGAAPVPRLTSAGERTPHSFQRMTQHFWLLYPHLLFPPLLQPFSFQNIILFFLHSKLPSDVVLSNCRTGRIYLSAIKTPPYHCPHSWMLLSVLSARQEVLCLHISTSVASIQPLSLWITSEWGQVVHLSHLGYLRPTTGRHFTECYLQLRDGY